jgi:hypothetical protein
MHRKRRNSKKQKLFVPTIGWCCKTRDTALGVSTYRLWQDVLSCQNIDAERAVPPSKRYLLRKQYIRNKIALKHGSEIKTS